MDCLESGGAWAPEKPQFPTEAAQANSFSLLVHLGIGVALNYFTGVTVGAHRVHCRTLCPCPTPSPCQDKPTLTPRSPAFHPQPQTGSKRDVTSVTSTFSSWTWKMWVWFHSPGPNTKKPLWCQGTYWGHPLQDSPSLRDAWDRGNHALARAGGNLGAPKVPPSAGKVT